MQCLRCGHEWKPRYDSNYNPKQCPKCKQYHYNKLPAYNRLDLTKNIDRKEIINTDDVKIDKVNVDAPNTDDVEVKDIVPKNKKVVFE